MQLPRFRNTKRKDELVEVTDVSKVTLPAEEQPHDVAGQPVVIGADLPAEIFLPSRVDGAPAIVMCAEAYGPNHATRTVAAALAERGFVVILPDYYRGEGPKDRENYVDFTEVGSVISKFNFRRGFLDIAMCIDYMRSYPQVNPDRVGVWGYCTGATLALAAACIHREVAAAVAFFPSQPRFVAHDDAHPLDVIDMMWTLQCPLLIEYGDEDAIWPLELRTEVERRSKAWELDAEFVLHPGAGHAFNAPVPPLRNDSADRLGWTTALEFIQKRLNS
ncbi:MAG: hypothetical protein F2923_00395 [Actinobacteria bacterium]|nr:hypothetical protein [Actinomycetota bacterium]MTB27082.1 hypothetical protein [Actinomycetota bacterium]